MAKASLSDILLRYPSTLLLTVLVSTSISSTNALALAPRDADSCPSSYKQCGSSSLPSNFCCPESSTCISLDNDSSAICCPRGESCSYIKPITCKVRLQDASKYPNSPVMSTRLGDKLPKCGDACCPFGYICQDGTCALNNSTASTATSILASTSSTVSATTLGTTTVSATQSTTETTSTTSPTQTQTPINLSTTSAPETASTEEKETCSSFPSGAVVTGFFPGMIIGAALALLGLLCIRKRQKRKYTTTHQSYKPNQRTSNGTVINISSPIPSDESSYRTDFLLRQNNDGRKRNSDSARSMLHRTGSRVKSLFASTPRLGGPSNVASNVNGRAGSSDDSIPAVPPLPLPVTPPRQIIPHRQPSMESIRVYSPAGGLAGGAATVRAVQYPAPARDRDRERGRAVARPDTTFSQMIDRVGFQDGRGEPCYRVLDTPTPTPMPGERRRRGG